MMIMWKSVFKVSISWHSSWPTQPKKPAIESFDLFTQKTKGIYHLGSSKGVDQNKEI